MDEKPQVEELVGIGADGITTERPGRLEEVPAGSEEESARAAEEVAVAHEACNN